MEVLTFYQVYLENLKISKTKKEAVISTIDLWTMGKFAFCDNEVRQKMIKEAYKIIKKEKNK